MIDVFTMWKAFNTIGVLLTVYAVSQLNRKMVRRWFTLPLLFGISWALITAAGQQILYFWFGPFPWATRLSEGIGLLLMLIAGVNLSFSDDTSTIRKFLNTFEGFLGG